MHVTRAKFTITFAESINKMKYSIIMPYIDRWEQFKKTIASFDTHYRYRNDFEVILVMDPKADKVFPPKNKNYPIHVVESNWSPKISNPAPLYNEGVKTATGNFLLITNPECYHETAILDQLDDIFEIDSNCYVVCACKALKVDGSFFRWFQHTEHRNNCYHFCSAISREQYWKYGGFDEEFAFGISYDDNAFRDNLKRNGVVFKVVDDMVVVHQWHRKIRPANWRTKLLKNEQIYKNKYKF